MYPFLRLARVGFGLISGSKVDLLETTRVHFVSGQTTWISTSTSTTVAILRSPTLAAFIGSCVQACWRLHDGIKRSPS